MLRLVVVCSCFASSTRRLTCSDCERRSQTQILIWAARGVEEWEEGRRTQINVRRNTTPLCCVTTPAGDSAIPPQAVQKAKANSLEKIRRKIFACSVTHARTPDSLESHPRPITAEQTNKAKASFECGNLQTAIEGRHQRRTQQVPGGQCLVSR